MGKGLGKGNRSEAVRDHSPPLTPAGGVGARLPLKMVAGMARPVRQMFPNVCAIRTTHSELVLSMMREGSSLSKFAMVVGDGPWLENT